VDLAATLSGTGSIGEEDESFSDNMARVRLNSMTATFCPHSHECQHAVANG
jgi:hypothetical protein